MSKHCNVYFLYIIAIVCCAFLMRTFGYGLYRVPSESMEKTMLVGELFFANKFSMLFEKPQHGDIIAFNDPTFPYSSNRFMKVMQGYVWGPSNWTKRVIGIPGDCLQGAIEHGMPVIYRNGQKIYESYILSYPKNYYFQNSDGMRVNEDYWDGSDEFYITLAPGQYWVMGDNRFNSHDSRAIGPLDGRLIHGKIVYRIASLDHASLLDAIMHPRDFLKSIRWERCAQRVI